MIPQFGLSRRNRLDKTNSNKLKIMAEFMIRNHMKDELNKFVEAMVQKRMEEMKNKMTIYAKS